MLDVMIHTQQFELTAGVRRFSLETLYEPLSKIWRRSGATLEIFLRDLRGSKGGIDKECRAVFTTPNGPKLVITEITEDMRKSIHQCRKRLLRRARASQEQMIEGPRRPMKYVVTERIPKALGGRAAYGRAVRAEHESQG